MKRSKTEVIEKIRAMRLAGASIEAICRDLRVGTHRVVAECIGLPVPARPHVLKPKAPKPPKPPKPLPLPVKTSGGVFGEDIERLRQREQKYENGILAATHAKAQLVREVIAGLENAQASAALHRATFRRADRRGSTATEPVATATNEFLRESA
jgi:hypothetical protein